MLDINFIRENPEVVKQAAADKLMDTNLDRLLELDTKIRELVTLIDSVRAERHALSKRIPQLSEVDRAQAVIRVKQIKEQLVQGEEQLLAFRSEFEQIMLTVPSVPAPEVPIGRSEADNVEIRKWGEIPKFAFPPKDHLELAETLDLVDLPRAVKFAGSRSYFLKNEGALLDDPI